MQFKSGAESSYGSFLHHLCTTLSSHLSEGQLNVIFLMFDKTDSSLNIRDITKQYFFKQRMKENRNW